MTARYVTGCCRAELERAPDGRVVCAECERSPSKPLIRGDIRYSVCAACGKSGLLHADSLVCVRERRSGPRGTGPFTFVRPDRCVKAEKREAEKAADREARAAA